MKSNVSLFDRLFVWIDRPNSYKIESIKKRLINILSFLILPLLQYFYKKILERSRIFRQAVFRTTEPNTLLISHCENEIFILSASDKVIARDVFIEKSPFDFDKFKLGVSLLDPNHQRTTLIDIGANIGTICIPAITRELFKHAIAIEPEPLNFKLLKANVVINDLSEKIELHNIALGPIQDDVVVFELSDINYGDHRVQGNNEGPEILNEHARKKIKVKSTTLNHLAKAITPSDVVVWMDVQGYEGYVLAGASDFLSKQVPICLEFWPYGLNRSGCYPQLKSALIKNGYKYFYNLHHEPVMQVLLTEESIDNLYNEIGESGDNVDLFFF
jgi:FkbM family methyltransferase